MKKLVRVREVTPLEDYHCRLVFEDGTQKVVNLKPYLHGPIFESILNDINRFRSVRVVDGTIGWDSGAFIQLLEAIVLSASPNLSISSVVL